MRSSMGLGRWKAGVVAGVFAGLCVGGASALAALPSQPQDVAPPVHLLQRAGAVDLAAALQAGRGDAIAMLEAADAPAAAIVDVLGDGLAELADASRASIDLPIAAGGVLRLELERFEVLAQDASVIEVTEHGERSVAPPRVQLWRGRVEGEQTSRAFLGVGPDGVQGFVRSQGRTLSIASVPAGADSPLAGRTLVTDVAQLNAASERLAEGDPARRRSLLAGLARCAGAIVEPGTVLPPVNTGRERADRGTGFCRVIRVAVDTDREFTLNLFADNAANATAYATQLMGAVSAIYQADTGVRITVPFLRVWTTADPYNSTSTSAQLNQFRTYWMSNRPSVPHDLAHLLSARNLGGGVAYLAALCNTSIQFGVSANLDGFFPMPVRDYDASNWDVFVTAHELGHNFASGHTHEISSYNPIVDGCGNGDCFSLPPSGGTIMSYCHQCDGGLSNIELAFGTRPSTVIRNYTYFSVPSCGLTLAAPTITALTGPTGIPCQGGTVQITANVGASDVPLLYTWYRGSTRLLSTSQTITVFLNGPSANGQYRVEVSNGCQTASSPSVQITICRGDFNCSGGQPSTQDIFDFLAAWFAGNSQADVNLSAGITVQDIFDFLGVWFPGC